MFLLHVYDPPFLPINKEDIVVDIGADIGLFSLYSKLKTINKVIAYEPCPPSFKMLNKNITVNSLKGKENISRLVRIANATDLRIHDNLFCFLPDHLKDLPKNIFV